ncbi:MAG: pentapeptide repeat-containing protein [Synechococcus sp.]|nr:pentapeptide repeat-containing protein [Synechococcus sp.]
MASTPAAIRPRAATRALAGPGVGSWTLILVALMAAAGPLGSRPAHAGGADQLIRLLQRGSCPGCGLQDADLVQADLREADLRRAQLQRANLSGSRLDGARFTGADLSFTSLAGASLRGADLRGARLEGTDLRGSDLSGALLDPGALARSHWQDARGISSGSLGYADLHNAGVRASLAGDAPQAERLFGEAIAQKPDAALSWLARGIARNDQGRTDLAAQDFRYAAVLYAQQGDEPLAARLQQAATDLDKPVGSGAQGSRWLAGAVGLVQSLASLALTFLPLGF